jgi:four helix bundle protein
MDEGTRGFDLEFRLVRFSDAVADIVEVLPESRVGNHIAGQLLRAGTAPAPDYAEALGAESRRDFIHKLKVGLKELRETAVWLKLIQHRQLVPPGDLLDKAANECNELTAIFVASIATARRNMMKEQGNNEYGTRNKKY